MAECGGNHIHRLDGRQVHHRILVDLLLGLDVIDNVRKRYGHLDILVIQAVEYLLDNQVAHFNHIVDEVVDFLRCRRLLLLHLRVGRLRECGDGTLLGLAGIVEWHMKVGVDFVQTHRDQW